MRVFGMVKQSMDGQYFVYIQLRVRVILCHVSLYSCLFTMNAPFARIEQNQHNSTNRIDRDQIHIIFDRCSVFLAFRFVLRAAISRL